ncbi:hypothetical protein IWX63_000879 [Arthrobacter sp. CAN_A2]|uniref:Wadjet anti-phage system protein JetD domain-containing protein n=1 Tax=Arthrobacter sp. CAN_A2 TaxID=2787718 RepID=UPI0018EF6ED0
MNGTGVPGEASTRWTSLADLRALSTTAWQRGTLVREKLEPTGIYPRRRALKKPTAAELRDHYPAARSWAAELTAAGPFSLELAEVGRTTIGANQVPTAAVFATIDDEIAFVHRSKDAVKVVNLAARLSELDPALRTWAVALPLQLLELGEDALTAARVALWLKQHPSPGIYVRQLSLPGVHTKFVEGHRRVIDGMLEVLTPEKAALPEDFSGTPAARFAARHGFLRAPEQVRFRVLDPDLQVFGGARDINVTAEAFAGLSLPVEHVIVTENLVNFLSLPDRPGTLALFGGGYGFSSLRDARWLRGCLVHYWGDLDTHGFQILDQLRAVHPQVASVLMDEPTLLAHRDRWGMETKPSRARLTRLTAAEADLYSALQQDVYGPSLRLEQELLRWDWVESRLTV